MARAGWITLASLLALGGCDGAAPVIPTAPPDAAPLPDGGAQDVGPDGAPADRGVEDLGAEDLGAEDLGPDLDQGDGALDGGAPDAADLAVDAALPDPPGVPPWPAIGGATVDGTTWLAWASGGTVRTGRLGPAGTLDHDPDAVLAQLELPVVRLAVVAAGEVPWAVWSASDGPVQVGALDAPDLAPLTLDLRGPALAAPLGVGSRSGRRAR